VSAFLENHLVKKPIVGIVGRRVVVAKALNPASFSYLWDNY
jgi:hypothetical protein